MHRDSCPLDCKVYVGNLGNNGNKTELERAFGYYGPLRSVWVARNPPGFAFVEFEDPRDAADAVRELDGRTLCGCRVRVELSNGEKRTRNRGPPQSWNRRPRDDYRRRSPPPRRRYESPSCLFSPPSGSTLASQLALSASCDQRAPFSLADLRDEGAFHVAVVGHSLEIAGGKGLCPEIEIISCHVHFLDQGADPGQMKENNCIQPCTDYIGKDLFFFFFFVFDMLFKPFFY
ncbi:unnamed protein product [Ranitomeya imitator]|uniref:RRM domain-containing protein n=1 Tax=Ranitomeya imitator TaxID=111125 RepID=A0ABN9MD83_9NEOB|nr:unnamed protein product [Ranitomeya imitator]